MLKNKSKVLSGLVLTTLIFVLTQIPIASAKSNDAFPNNPASLLAFSNDALAFFDSRKADIKDDSDKFAPEACVAAPSGLVSWYHAENNANDSKGANHGTLQNGATFAAGKVGQAFNFTALNQRVEIPDSASLDLTNAVTLEAWVEPSQFGEADSGTTFVSKSDLTALNNQPYGLVYSSNGKVLMRIGNNTTLDQIESTTILPLNTFSYVAGTYDGTTIRIYVNGVLENSKVTSIGAMVTNNLPVRIGANNLNGYLGKIDELSIYNRALSDSEIQSIFNAGSAGKCVATTPTAASVSVGGRVTTVNGRGIGRARVSLTDASGETRTALTNSFGYYRFADVAAGGTYIFNVSHKSYEFAPQVLNINEERSDVNFSAPNPK